MLLFLQKANWVERFLRKAAMEREDPGRKGHDLSDASEGWLDDVWEAAEAIRLYGSEETAAAAETVCRALQSFGAALPDVSVDLGTALALAIEAYRKAVRLDLGIDRPR